MAGGLERNERLFEGLSPTEVVVLLAQIDRLTERAAVCARLKKLELMHACDRLGQAGEGPP